MPIPDLSSREPIPASADDDRIPPPESDPRGPSLRSSPPSYSSSVFSRDSRDLSSSPRQTLVHYQRIPRGVASPSVAVLSFALPHNFNFVLGHPHNSSIQFGFECRNERKNLREGRGGGGAPETVAQISDPADGKKGKKA
ncbi:hypothetical protein niasHT_011358 [Heterodera trifolii]|uniref:Uncharacterized protein n=1 Tax=Heterodera trifolii TaxID=157864 RepID=A0ABD2LI63_9BILA